MCGCPPPGILASSPAGIVTFGYISNVSRLRVLLYGRRIREASTPQAVSGGGERVQVENRCSCTC